MISIGNDPGGRRRLLISCADGRRRTIRLGKIDKRSAEDIRLRLERIASAAASSAQLSADSTEWLASLDDKFHAKLAAAGLVKARSATALGPFIDAYIADRTDAKDRTIINLKAAREDLCKFFSADRSMLAITEADADAFMRHLLRRGLSANSARRLCGRAKQFYRVAIRRRLLTVNPFADIKCHVTGNLELRRFISAEVAASVLNACPDLEWKLIFALARWGGLRTPSETLQLRWADIDWDRARIRVRSPKTEAHERKASRVIPLFPELRPLLLEAFAAAEEGEEFVITRYRGGSANLRTQLARIIERAGVDPWPKLFQNLRSTRQTELSSNYPLHVVCAWIGNSAAIARDHYLQIIDQHFTDAIMEGEGEGERPAQNAARQGAADGGNARKSEELELVGASDLPNVAAPLRASPETLIPLRGVEPLSSG